MYSLLIFLVTFVSIALGGALGMLVRIRLPQAHLSESKEVIRLGAGLILRVFRAVQAVFHRPSLCRGGRRREARTIRGGWHRRQHRRVRTRVRILRGHRTRRVLRAGGVQGK